MAGSGLVISPFLPRPSDAGHRKRAFESCLLLKDLGYRLTLVHLAFEGAWYWRRQAVDRAELALCGIEHYHEVYADDLIGRPPRSGGTAHHLDEWWHPALEALLANHLRRHHYEVAVVHNVWLSKAFDLLPAHTTRVIETHDLFSVREAQFGRIGARQDFYACSEGDEVFGLKRAHVAIAIKEEDRRWIAARAPIDTVTVAPRPERRQRGRSGYRHPEKVTFGFMGSAHPFNLHCLAHFLADLTAHLRLAPVALEFIVAGTVSQALDLSAHPYVRPLGFVADVAEFYDAVDFVVSPLDHGTGVKIKVAEAIDFEVPVLATAHSAEGTCLDPGLVEPNKAALVQRVLAITRERTDFRLFHKRAASSRLAASTAYAQSREQLQRTLVRHRRRVVLDLPELLLPAAHPLRALATCTLRMYAGQGSVRLIADASRAEAFRAAARTMPSTVEVVPLEFDVPAGPDECFLDVRDESLAELFEGAALHGSRPQVRSLHARVEVLDERFGLDDTIAADGPGRMRARTVNGRRKDRGLVLPLFSDVVYWDPALAAPAFDEQSALSCCFVRVPAGSRDALARYVRILHPGHRAITYSSDAELSALLPELLRSGRLGRTVFVPATTTRLELALIEYLRCFGCDVRAGLGLGRQPETEPAPASRPASALHVEARVTGAAVDFVCTAH